MTIRYTCVNFTALSAANASVHSGMKCNRMSGQNSVFLLDIKILCSGIFRSPRFKSEVNFCIGCPLLLVFIEKGKKCSELTTIVGAIKTIKPPFNSKHWYGLHRIRLSKMSTIRSFIFLPSFLLIERNINDLVGCPIYFTTVFLKNAAFNSKRYIASRTKFLPPIFNN